MKWGKEGGGGFGGFFKACIWVCEGVCGWRLFVEDAVYGLGWETVLEEYL